MCFFELVSYLNPYFIHSFQDWKMRQSARGNTEESAIKRLRAIGASRFEGESGKGKGKGRGKGRKKDSERNEDSGREKGSKEESRRKKKKSKKSKEPQEESDK